MNLIQIFQKFPTQESCVTYLESVRWKDEITCAYCKSNNTYKLKNTLRHHCNFCKKSFSVTVNTIFHDSRLPLQKWFLSIALILNAKKGISAMQLQRDIDVTYKTAWSMGHRIRQAMNSEDGLLLSGIVEMDETYVGGKPKKRFDDDDDALPNKRGRGTKKIPVIGMVERNGSVKATAIDKDKLKFVDISTLLRNSVDMQATQLITDKYRGYSPMKNLLPHSTINHTIAYVDGDVHTNTIEGFWSILKRSIVGQYHKVSAGYLQRYIDEIAFKYNHRELDGVTVFNKLIGKMLLV